MFHLSLVVSMTIVGVSVHAQAKYNLVPFHLRFGICMGIVLLACHCAEQMTVFCTEKRLMRD